MEEFDGIFYKILEKVGYIFLIVSIIGVLIIVLLGFTYIGLDIYNEILLLI